MDQLMISRINKAEEATNLDNLSPEKFGRSAYARLSYTPSKLAGTVLYKQVTQMKKTQEYSNKLRECQALNQIQKDKIRHLQSQKQSIQSMLNQQIVMYKKMIEQLEEQLEQRVKELQYSFSQQIRKIIVDKDEEAKYVQSQKQMLQNRIEELEIYLADFKEQLGYKNDLLEKKTQEYDLLQSKYNQACDKVKELQKQLDQKEAVSKQQIDELNRIHNEQLALSKTSIQNSLALKEQQLRDLAKAFDDETKRLKEQISGKDQETQLLANQLNEEIQKSNKITKNYMEQITALKKQKNELDQQCQTLNHNLKTEQEQARKAHSASSQTTNYYQQRMNGLQQDLEIARVSLMREHQRNFKEKQQIKQQLLSLKKSADESRRMGDQNTRLCKEIHNLKDLLLESSLQMERSKDQFYRICSQKELLITKMQQLDLENETLHRISIERQQQAKTWRESYYKYRR